MNKSSLYGKTAQEILSQLPSRTQEVLLRRYGLGGSEPETLEKIGQRLGVTRERVRQIEANGLRQLREQTYDAISSIFDYLEQHLDDHGGIRAEHSLYEDLMDRAEPEVLKLFLDLGDAFSRHRETDHRHAAWSLDAKHVKDAEAFERAVVSRLKGLDKEMEEAEFWVLVEEEARKRRLALSGKALQSWVGMSRNIQQGPRGGYGLKTWSGIVPRNVGDWAFIVLREAQEPMHFTDIVEHMNELRLDDDYDADSIHARNRKPAHLQTVHNELIKDDRFVLVGRGVYALREWGYEPGTVRDVILRILSDAKRPMPREEIVAKVSEVRRVQPNTVLLNLQNKQAFARTPDGKYEVRRT